VVRPLRRIIAWSPTRERLDEYCREMSREGFEIEAAPSVEAVCAVADVIVTTTPARTPVVRASWLRPGVHVTAVGSDSPGKQELEADCLDRADLVVVDRLSQCSAFGELRHALDAALLTRHDIHGELGAIVAGKRPGRTSESQITIADLTGVGFQDTAIASAAFERLRH
jgi:ornithine cyclodeaminase